MHSIQLLFLSISVCLAVPYERSSSHIHHARQYGGDENRDFFGGRHKFIPASQVDGASRTSCPFLNTAANHGFLPRDGRQVSIAQFDQAIIDSLNFAPDFAHGITTGMLTKLGVITNDTTANAKLRLDLAQTNAHGKTEHDASITRLDASNGDSLRPNAKLIDEFMKDTLPMSYAFLNSTSIGRTRVRRERESLRTGNPPLSDLFEAGAQGEAALILTIMADDTGPVTAENADSRKAPKDRVKSWLLKEKFPTEEGFKRPARQVRASENKFVVESVAKWQAWMEDPAPPPSKKAGIRGNGQPKTNEYFASDSFDYIH